jgi:hypothetical protein
LYFHHLQIEIRQETGKTRASVLHQNMLWRQACVFAPKCLTVARNISVVKKLDLEIKLEWPISLAKEPPYASKLASEHTAHKRETE